MRNLPHPRTHFPKTVLHACAFAAALVAGTAAQAQEADDPAWAFRGFGTLGAVHSDYDQADFTSSVLKHNGVGASKSTSLTPDSRLGAQVDLKLNSKWSAVLQVGIEQRYDSSYRTQVEWGNVKYQATPDLALRVGRVALPIFLAADYRKIGYAYPWVRTPAEVYGGIPITNSDGVDVAYRWRYAGVKHTTQVFFGMNDIHLDEEYFVKARDLGGITHTAEIGALTFRISGFKANLNANAFRPLFDGFRQFGPQGIAIADKYDVLNKRTSGFAFGVNYDPGTWFVSAEGGRIKSNSVFSTSHGAFVTGGYRIAEFTPYMSLAYTEGKQFTDDKGLSLAGLPPAYAYAASQLNAGLQLAFKTVAVQRNITAGVRWDFRSDMALKLQYERVTPMRGSRGTLSDLQPGYQSDHPINVTSASLDFVF